MNKRPHYFYRVAASTKVGKQLQAFLQGCTEASETALRWAEKHGVETYYESSNGMAGGIAAVEFKNTIEKEGWDKITSPDGQVYFFPEEGSELEKEMYALPIVSEFALIPILKCKQRKNGKGQSIPFTFGDLTPILFLHQDYWYVDVPYECEAEGLTIITEKKFYRSRLAAVNED